MSADLTNPVFTNEKAAMQALRAGQNRVVEPQTTGSVTRHQQASPRHSATPSR